MTWMSCFGPSDRTMRPLTVPVGPSGTGRGLAEAMDANATSRKVARQAARIAWHGRRLRRGLTAGLLGIGTSMCVMQTLLASRRPLQVEFGRLTLAERIFL